MSLSDAAHDPPQLWRFKERDSSLACNLSSNKHACLLSEREEPANSHDSGQSSPKTQSLSSNRNGSKSNDHIKANNAMLHQPRLCGQKRRPQAFQHHNMTGTVLNNTEAQSHGGFDTLTSTVPKWQSRVAMNWPRPNSASIAGSPSHRTGPIRNKYRKMTRYWQACSIMQACSSAVLNKFKQTRPGSHHWQFWNMRGATDISIAKQTRPRKRPTALHNLQTRTGDVRQHRTHARLTQICQPSPAKATAHGGRQLLLASKTATGAALDLVLAAGWTRIWTFLGAERSQSKGLWT